MIVFASEFNCINAIPVFVIEALKTPDIIYFFQSYFHINIKIFLFK